ncbi:MAG: peptide ABC transporter substrate-binding protein [Dehalococcoidia bacterium]
MSDRTGGQEWWQDPEQLGRFEKRLSATALSRRAVLGIVGAFASGAAVIACGGASKDRTPASSGGSGSAPSTGASQPATGEKLAKTQVYRRPLRDEPATWDYNFNLYAMASNYVSAGLLKYDADNKVVPDLAESVTVNDKGDVYTFKIRKDTKWSNGDPVKAQDFVYSWSRRLDPTSGADYAAFLYDIKNAEEFNTKKIADKGQLGLKAIDDATLEVTLGGPAGYFPALVAYQAAVPVHPATAEKFKEKTGTDADKFVSSGPFKLVKWEHNKVAEITKNEGYWNAKNIKLEKVVFPIIKKEQWHVAYENNEIDDIQEGSIGELKRLTGDPKLSKEIIKYDQFGSWYLMPNPRFKPFDNIKVRQAMAHAVDRDKLVKDVLGGMGAPAYTQMNPGTPQYNPNKYDQYTKFDPKVAMDLLKGTEYEGGKNWPKITMSMRNNETDAHKAAMQAIIQMYKEHLGMTIDSEVGDPQVIYREMRQGNKQLMWLRWYLDYPDANNAHGDCFYSKIPVGSRRSWWENDEFDKLVLAGRSEPNQEKRKQIYAQADEILVREAAAVFVYYPLAFTMRKPTVRGFAKNKEGAVVPDWNIFQRELDGIYLIEV